MSIDQYPSCFDARVSPSSDAPCPVCGYALGQPRSPLALPLGTRLSKRYRVGRILGDLGGFGVTYLALDERLEVRVAIKEYVPRELAGRDTDGQTLIPYSTGDGEAFAYGLERFLGEARALAQFDHANIVGIRDFFEAHGTACLVMDYYEGTTLRAYLAEQPEGRMDPALATEIMLRVLDGLRELHAAGYLHRDIKPSNIYLTEAGRPILIDFGAARLALGEQSRSLSVVLTEGYAPYEQYRRRGSHGPHTDVYGCGATLYRMVTGQKPPAASDRVVDDRLVPAHEACRDVPTWLGGLIGKSIACLPNERFRSADAFYRALAKGLDQGWETNQPADIPPAPDKTRNASGVTTSKRFGASAYLENPEVSFYANWKKVVSASGIVILLALAVWVIGRPGDVFQPEPVQEVSISMSPTSPDTETEVQFQGQAVGDEPIKYSWDFGNGSTASGPSTYYTFEEPGEYQVNLTVSNEGGSESKVRSLNVEPAGPQVKQLDVTVEALVEKRKAVSIGGETLSLIFEPSSLNPRRESVWSEMQVEFRGRHFHLMDYPSMQARGPAKNQIGTWREGDTHDFSTSRPEGEERPFILEAQKVGSFMEDGVKNVQLEVKVGLR